MSEPLVSIIINCYNGEKYLAQAIESVLAQTYPNWEIIFWDNQSTDRSAQIARNYSNPRLKYFYAPEHTGLYAARNLALDKAQGQLFAFLDVDDWWLPDKLARQVPLFGDSQVGFVCANYWIESERKGRRWLAVKRAIPSGWVLSDLLRSYFVGLLTLMIRRTALTSLEYPCDARFPLMGDRDLVVRLSVHWKSACVQEPLAVFRLHGGNETVMKRDRIHDELGRWIEEMEKVDIIRSSPSFRFVRHDFTYQRALNRLLEGDRRSVFRLLPELPYSRFKIKLCAALLMPLFVVRRLKN